MTRIDPYAALETMRLNGEAHAAAKAKRTYIEGFLKSKKAMLMAQAGEIGIKTTSAQEAWAYAHSAYVQQLEGLRVAVEDEETARWAMLTAQAELDVWRSVEASNRGMDRGAR